jgi:hypothetical protein
VAGVILSEAKDLLFAAKADSSAAVGDLGMTARR